MPGLGRVLLVAWFFALVVLAVTQLDIEGGFASTPVIEFCPRPALPISATNTPTVCCPGREMQHTCSLCDMSRHH
jgi:hypothetical protein